jgi:hypothetical protein
VPWRAFDARWLFDAGRPLGRFQGEAMWIGAYLHLLTRHADRNLLGNYLAGSSPGVVALKAERDDYAGWSNRARLRAASLRCHDWRRRRRSRTPRMRSRS